MTVPTRLQWGRGLSTAEIAPRTDPASGLGFNGAAVFQPRKSALNGARDGRSGFNGAAVFQPRKFVQPTNRLLVTQLQWGRGLSTAEIFPSSGRDQRVWLQWGRGFSTAEISAVLTAHVDPFSFNGAAVFQPRKFSRSAAVNSAADRFNGAAVFQPRKCAAGTRRQPGRASMGPRSFNRGNHARMRRYRWSTTLRWGRGFSTAEIRRLPRIRMKDVLASMGPRSFNRGNRMNEDGRMSMVASMGPRSFNRGNSAR